MSAAAAPPSLFEKAITRLFLRPVQVTGVQQLTPAFCHIELSGESLRGLSWSPGDKLQIKLDEGLASRTYTPIHWDAEEGSVSLLCFCHGDGPGRDWVRHVRPGEQRHVFGPRSSLQIPPQGPLVVFGDETSVALAAACAAYRAAAEPELVMEAGDVTEMEDILARLELPAAAVIRRRQDDAHLDEVVRALLTLNVPATTFLLTGKATSIQYVLRALKAAGIPAGRIRSKAYWAPGKIGLD